MILEEDSDDDDEIAEVYEPVASGSTDEMWVMCVECDPEVLDWDPKEEVFDCKTEGCVMPVINDVPVANDVETFVMLDGGSDEHCCRADFTGRSELRPSDTLLRDAQKHRIPVAGQATVPMMLGNTVTALTNFQVGPFSRNLFSTGKLFDAGFDIIYSHELGCYVKKGGRQVDMTRKGNVFGLTAKTFDTIYEAKAALKSTKYSAKAKNAYCKDEAEVIEYVMPIAANGNEEHLPEFSNLGELEEHNVTMDEDDLVNPAVRAAGDAAEAAAAAAPALPSARAATFPGEAAAAAAPEAEDVAIETAETTPGAPVALGPNSRVEILRGRLKELKEPIWGVKQVLWNRLAKAEIRVLEEQKERELLEQRHELRIAGIPVDVHEVPAPRQPTPQERARHELTHTPPEKWCEECVMGQDAEDAHKNFASEDRVIPMLYFDFAYNAATGEDGEDAPPDTELGTSLVAVDRDSGFAYGNALASKDADAYSCKEINGFVKQMGYASVELRCDNEPAVKAIQQGVLAIRSKEKDKTILTNGKTKDSKSMGLVETTIRWWRGKLKTFRFSVENRYGRKITPKHLMWSWLARHSAWTTSRYRVRGDGTTAFFGVYGHEYQGEICGFAETVLFKAPASHTRQKKGNRRQHKADSVWTKGIWVGKTNNNDEHILLTPEGKYNARSVRRLEETRRYDVELFDKIAGLPWQDRLLAVRGQVRTLSAGIPTPVPLAGEVPTEGPAAPSAGPAAPSAGPAAPSAAPPAQVTPPAAPAAPVGPGVPPVVAGPAAAAAPQAPSTPVPRGRGRPRKRESTTAAETLEQVGTVPEGAQRRPASDGGSVEAEARERSLHGPSQPGGASSSGGNVLAVEAEARELNEGIDYSQLKDLDELDYYNTSMFSNEDVIAGKVVGLQLLDEFEVYDIYPSEAAQGKKHVDTRWEISMRAGALKCRLVGREYRTLEDRDDLFAPGATANTGRVIDFLGMKDDLDAEDPIVTAIGDCTSAYYQTPEEEDFFCTPPAEWLEWRRSRGLSVDVVWKLKKQLPGRREAGKKWIEFCAGKFVKECGLVRYEPMPQFFRQENARLALELHMDDFHLCGRQSEVRPFLVEAKKHLKLKSSDVIIVGTYEHLKRTRVKTTSGTFVAPHEKHSANIIAALGLEGANSVRTPDLDADEPLEAAPLDKERHGVYRKCVGHGIYLAIDRFDCQRAVGQLGRDLAAPTEHSWRKLIRFGRYLIGTSDYGVWMPKPCARNVGKITVMAESDTDHAGDKRTRKSASCKFIVADGVPLYGSVKRLALNTLSSGESEFYGLVDAALESKPFVDLFRWMGFDVRWEVGTDSSAARAMSLRQGIGKVRHLDTRSLWIQYAVGTLGLVVRKLSGLQNISDLGTKVHGVERFEMLRAMAGIRSMGSLADRAPVVDVSSITSSLQCGGEDLEKIVASVVTVLLRTSAGHGLPSMSRRR